MKKTTFLLVLIFVLLKSSGQNQFVRFDKEIIINEDKDHKLAEESIVEFPLKIYEGEIFECCNISFQNYIIYGRDTLKCGEGHFKIYEQEKNDSLFSLSNQILLKYANDSIVINIKSLRKLYDLEYGIRCICDNEMMILPDEEFYTLNLGCEQFRIMVPDFPSIIIKKGNINIPTFPENEYIKFTLKNNRVIFISKDSSEVYFYKKEINTIYQNDKWKKCFRNVTLQNLYDEGDKNLMGSSFLKHYILRYNNDKNKWAKVVKWSIESWMLVILLSIIVLIFIIKTIPIMLKWFRKTKEPKKITFTEPSLKQFAKNNNIEVRKLISLNKKTLRKYKIEAVETDENNKNIIDNLCNQKVDLVVGYREEKQKEEKQKKEKISINKNDIKIHVDQKIDELKDEISKLSNKISQESERNINKEIKEKNVIIDRLKERIKSVEKENIRLSKHEQFILHIPPAIKQLANRYKHLLSTFEKFENELQQIVKKSKEKASDIEKEIMLDIYSDFNLEKKSDIQKWKLIIDEMGNEFSTYSKVINSLKVYEKDDGKVDFFRKYFYTDFLKDYIYISLRTSDELSHLSAFTKDQNSTFVKNVEDKFRNFVEKIKNETKECSGFEINHTPFLSHYTKNPQFTESTESDKGGRYSRIDTDEGNIIFVKKYGYKIIFDYEDKITNVMVAK